MCHNPGRTKRAAATRRTCLSTTTALCGGPTGRMGTGVTHAATSDACRAPTAQAMLAIPLGGTDTAQLLQHGHPCCEHGVSMHAFMHPPHVQPCSQTLRNSYCTGRAGEKASADVAAQMITNMQNKAREAEADLQR
eukprot:scaffold14783_cov23-Tisochrysis_lutea.AAC.1